MQFNGYYVIGCAHAKGQGAAPIPRHRRVRKRTTALGICSTSINDSGVTHVAGSQPHTTFRARRLVQLMAEIAPLGLTDDTPKPATVLRLVHLDYGGYPCQVQLSRALAARSHEILHLFCPAYVGGKGRVNAEPGDPATFKVEPLLSDEPFERYSPLSRLRHEVKFANSFLKRLKVGLPDVVIVANVPLLSLWLIGRGLRRTRVPYVFWQQDVTSRAIAHGARARLGAAGGGIGRAAIAMSRAAQYECCPSELPSFPSWRAGVFRPIACQLWVTGHRSTSCRCGPGRTGGPRNTTLLVGRLWSMRGRLV